MTRVEIRGISKSFDKVEALRGIDLDIRSGELFSILGPSGCGKTTLLRIIAGLEVPDRGRIFFDGEDVTEKKPFERNAAMVFQNYALWPHMSVYENIAFGLRARKVPEHEIRRRVREVIELVRLEGLEDRLPLQLSGGQQQRVALARALVVEPRVLLLDEPLSNLDASLRIEMREEIKRIQRALGITTIYVTHDQGEALGISDRIAVMRAGEIIQVGEPEELYYNPKNVFVARFLGRGNVLYGRAIEIDGKYIKVSLEESGIDVAVLGVPTRGGARVNPGDRVAVLIRPESLSTAKPRDPGRHNVFRGRIDLVMFSGDRYEVTVDIGGAKLTLYTQDTGSVLNRDSLEIYSDPDRTKIIPVDRSV